MGSKGKGEGQFVEPTGITVDREGNILVATGWQKSRKVAEIFGNRFVFVIIS